MSRSLKLIIEAILFSSEKPINAREIHACLPDAKISDIKSALEVLKYEYETMGRSFAIKEVANGYQFRSLAEYGPYILRMLQTSPNRLSRAAMETLAIIAYKQPILRHEIERLRGVDVGGILRTLLEKDLIRIMGRKELPGRPLIYGTTKRFLETFELKNIASLPKLKEIRALGAEEFEPTITDDPSEAQSGEDIKKTFPPEDHGTPEEGPGEENTEEKPVPNKPPSEETIPAEEAGREAEQDTPERNPAD